MVTRKKSQKKPSEAKPKKVKKVAKEVPHTANGAHDVNVTHTVAHVEAVQAKEQENVEFQEKAELSDAELIRKAWDEVKDESDPAFDQCAVTHQEKLHYHAQSVLKGSGILMEGDSPVARFERAVVRLKAQQGA